MQTPLRFLLAPLLGAVLAASAWAASPSLLADINPGVPDENEAGVAGSFLPLGRVALVPVFEPGSGRELWVTDGTDAGTRPLLDACPGPCSPQLGLLGIAGNVAFFSIELVSLPRPQLWRSDGTTLGTFRLDRSGGRVLQPCDRSYSEGAAAVAGSTLFFSAQGDDQSCALWKTDGTVAGTRKVREIIPPEFFNVALGEVTAAGERIFFLASDEDAIWLWRSDGTPAGTVRLRSWSHFQTAPRGLVAAGSRLFFLAAEEGTELWTSDGTAAGTRPVTRFAVADPEFTYQEIDGHLYFVANDGTNGREIWETDGTAGGTRPVTYFTNANPFPIPIAGNLEKLAGRLIFPANDGLSGLRLWTTNGRPTSTARLDGCPGGCPVLPFDLEVVRAGSRIFFSALSGETGCGHPDDPPPAVLWVSDGTAAGTRKLRQFCPCCRLARLSPLREKVFFAAGQHFSSYDLWGSDGTAQGTRILARADSFAEHALPVPPVSLGSLGLFAIPRSLELWAGDGTPEGTHPVTRIGGSGLSSSVREMTPLGGGVLFRAFSRDSFGLWKSHGTAEATAPLLLPVHPSRMEAFGALALLVGEIFPAGLWKTDGTPAGTVRLTPGELDAEVSELAVLPGRALFLLDDAVWTTDGTPAGTQPVPGAPPAVHRLSSIGSEAAFISFNGSDGIALWISNGTAAGTRLLASGFRRLEDPLGVVRLGSTFYFIGDRDGSNTELWRSDGTAAGTRPVAAERMANLGHLTAHAGALYVINWDGLWKTDGTEAGTSLLRSFFIRGSLTGVNPWFTSLGGLLFFVREGENGIELWRTDGTPEGTAEVRDIAEGEASSFPAELTLLGNRLYFSAYEKDHGVELWETDGTHAGTRLVQDIAPGAFSSAPEQLTASGGRLYFTADDGVNGREPWVYAPGGAGCVPSDFVLCLGGGRFKVEADWRDFEGGSGRGRAVSLTADTGYFWFFEPSNVEVILKALDGRGINGHHWVFYGALSSVEYTLTVTDTQSGAARRYINPPNRLGSVADTQAFGPLGASAAGTVTLGPAPMVGEAIVSTRSSAPKAACAPSSTRLCLNNGRFAVEARWKAQGNSGAGQAVALPGGDTGYFWFFDANNVEVVLKVLDGRPLNNKFWVFYGALSNVEYTLTVTDTVTGTVKTYTNPAGRLASVADTEAF